MNISKNYLIDLNDESKWNAGLKELYSDYNKIVEITEDSFEHFLCCVPPKVQHSNSYVSGEPYSHNADGRGIYLCAIKIKDKYYAQMGTILDFLNKKLFK